MAFLTVTIVVQKKKVAASGISNVSKSLKLKRGEKYRLAPVISPITTADKASYRSSNKKVVTVSKKGVITAKKSGTAKYYGKGRKEEGYREGDGREGGSDRNEQSAGKARH